MFRTGLRTTLLLVSIVGTAWADEDPPPPPPDARPPAEAPPAEQAPPAETPPAEAPKPAGTVTGKDGFFDPSATFIGGMGTDRLDGRLDGVSAELSGFTSRERAGP